MRRRGRALPEDRRRPAAAVLAADAAFTHVLAERTAAVPRVSPLRAVPDDLSGLGLLAAGGHADLDPGRAGPARVRMRTPGPASR